MHFDTTAVRLEKAWSFGINANLPNDIMMHWAKIVDDDFHARFSAAARRYRYIIYNHKLRPAILASGLTHYRVGGIIPFIFIKQHKHYSGA